MWTFWCLRKAGKHTRNADYYEIWFIQISIPDRTEKFLCFGFFFFKIYSQSFLHNLLYKIFQWSYRQAYTFIIFFETYRSFHGIGQAKFAYGGSILGPSQLTLLYCPAASKNDAQFKSGQNWLENNHHASLI